MEQHIDNSFDKHLLNISSLTWLPWIGKDFKKNSRRLLIVGESHYALGDNDEDYQKRFREATDNKTFTRECIMNHQFVVIGEITLLTIFIELY